MTLPTPEEMYAEGIRLRKKRKITPIVGIVAVISLLGVFAIIPRNSEQSNMSSTAVRKNQPSGDVVTYRIDGSSGKYSVTCTNAEGGTEMFDNVGNDWEYHFWVNKEFLSGKHLYLSAQNKRDVGSVNVQIWINNHVWKQSQSDGGFVIASANGFY